MKYRASLIAVVLVSSWVLKAGVYDDDTREFVTKNSPAKILELSRSVALQVPGGRIDNFSDRAAQFYTAQAPSYQQEWNTCDGVRFNETPSLSICTAFLVGPKTILTAGHCGLVNQAGCDSTAWVFDFYDDNEKMIRKPSTRTSGMTEVTIPADQVFRCARILESKYDPNGTGVDFSLIELDRVAVGRTPLKLKKDGRFTGQEKIFSIGGSGGTPLVYTTPEKVFEVTDQAVRGPIDIIAKGSGGPMFDAATYEVVGITVLSSKDFYYPDFLPGASLEGREKETCSRPFLLKGPWAATIRDFSGVEKKTPFSEALRFDYIEKWQPFLGRIR